MLKFRRKFRNTTKVRLVILHAEAACLSVPVFEFRKAAGYHGRFHPILTSEVEALCNAITLIFPSQFWSLSAILLIISTIKAVFQVTALLCVIFHDGIREFRRLRYFSMAVT